LGEFGGVCSAPDDLVITQIFVWKAPLLRRVATADFSRGFQSTVGVARFPRRVATPESPREYDTPYPMAKREEKEEGLLFTIASTHQSFKRRYATRKPFPHLPWIEIHG